MSNHVLPALFISLGGEMLYVLDQRLRAQEVALQKGSRVMGEVVTNMFSKILMEELFKQQSIYSRRGIGAMFERLVNSSIMRIDSDSMEKLYDLMLMTFKYQIVKCENVSDILHVVLNHLDAILEFVKQNPEAEKLALEGLKKSIQLYEKMPPGDLVFIKQSLLGFLHDLKSKVSVLVNMGDQNTDGTFIINRNGMIPSSCNIPGTIHYCDEGRTENFTVGSTFRNAQVGDATTDIGGKRSTRLGTNLYAGDVGNVHSRKFSALHPHTQSLAEAEVKLLSHLMGASSDKKGASFKLDLFGHQFKNKEKSSNIAPSQKKNSLNDRLTIKAEKVNNQELSDIKGDFNDLGQSSDEPDLLSLMDNA